MPLQPPRPAARRCAWCCHSSHTIRITAAIRALYRTLSWISCFSLAASSSWACRSLIWAKSRADYDQTHTVILFCKSILRYGTCAKPDSRLWGTWDTAALCFFISSFMSSWSSSRRDCRSFLSLCSLLICSSSWEIPRERERDLERNDICLLPSTISVRRNWSWTSFKPCTKNNRICHVPSHKPFKLLHLIHLH